MRVLVLAGVVALVAGCGAPPPDEVMRRPAVTVPEAVPPGMALDSPPPQVPPRPECASGGFDPRAVSLRPPASMPPPGQMPAGSTMARILDRKRLVAGVDQNLNRFSSRNPSTGQLEGFDIDVVKAITKALFGDETKVQLRSVNFSDNFAALTSGEIDILVDSLTITCERRHGLRVMFSTNYFDSGQRILVRARSPYRSADDLGGKKVCAPAGTTSIRYIHDYPGAELVPVAVTEFDDCLVLLQQNQIDAISSTDTILIGMREQDPSLEIRGPRFTDEPHGVAVRESEQDWIRFVNGVLEQMRQNGTWRQAYVKWLGGLHPDGDFPDPPAAQYTD